AGVRPDERVHVVHRGGFIAADGGRSWDERRDSRAGPGRREVRDDGSGELIMRSTIIIALLILTGCGTHYVTPGAGAKMEMFGGATPAEQAAGTDGGIATILDKKPLASFPASVAIVRVQAPGY